MAYSDNFPATRPVFMADFANGGRIDPRASFTRSDTPPTYAAPSAVHYWSNEKHLSSENLLLHSEDFTTSWSTSEANGSAGVTAPDGGSDAYTITCYTASSKSPRVNQNLSGKLAANTQYTMVGHVKAGTATHGYISFRGTNSNNYAYAQIEFASPSSPSTGGAGFTGISGTVTALGSSWYKLTLTATTGSDVSGAFAFLGVNDGTAFGISGYPIWNTAGETLEVWGAQVSTTQSKVYDSPTTTQISREYAPTLKSVATAGQPRFEYDPATDGQSVAKGILVEGQSTNLATYGSDLTNAAWNPLSAFIGGTAVGPDGTLSAVKLVASAASGLYPRFRRLSLLTDTTQTFSIYVKPLEFQHLAISADGSTSSLVQYNLSGNGAITSATGATGAVEQCGNGWFRVSFSYTTVPNAHLAITMQSSTTYQAETGNGYDGMLFALAQLESQSFASSYIATTSSTATRAAESLSVVSSDLFDNGDTTIMCDVTVPTDTGTVSSGVSSRFFRLENSSAPATGENYEVYRNSTGKIVAEADAGGASVASYYVANSSPAGNYKLAVRYGSDSKAYLNGAAGVSSDSSMPNPSGLDTLRVGHYSNTGGFLNGHVKRVALYNEALSDTNLQALTS